MDLKRLFQKFERDHYELNIQIPLSDYIADSFQGVQTIRAHLNKLAQEKHEVRVSMGKKLTLLDFKISAIRTECCHPITRYHGDPSGGSDSSTTCEICEYEL